MKGSLQVIDDAAFAFLHDALTDWVTVAIAGVSLVLLLTTELDTLWIILGAAVISLSASSLGIVAYFMESVQLGSHVNGK